MDSGALAGYFPLIYGSDARRLGLAAFTVAGDVAIVVACARLR